MPEVHVGRTLLSAAVAVDFAIQKNLFRKMKIKSGGQECPPHIKITMASLVWQNAASAVSLSG